MELLDRVYLILNRTFVAVFNISCRFSVHPPKLQRFSESQFRMENPQIPAGKKKNDHLPLGWQRLLQRRHCMRMGLTAAPISLKDNNSNEPPITVILTASKTQHEKLQ